jgi:hypothetical protein
VETVLQSLGQAPIQTGQPSLFDQGSSAKDGKVLLVDRLHVLIALADAGESVLPWLERFDGRRTEVLAGLRFVRGLRSDWEGAIDRVIAVMEGAPLLRPGGTV